MEKKQAKKIDAKGIENSLLLVKIVEDKDLPPERQSEASLYSFNKKFNVLPGTVKTLVAQFQEIKEYEPPSPVNTPEKYYQHVVLAPNDRKHLVEYEADEQDFVWLEMLNKERMETQLRNITIVEFEKVMDRLEKNSFLQAVATHDEACCDICLQDCNDFNALIYCELCGLGFHQECYGVPIIPEGDFLCRNCDRSPLVPMTCSLCPITGGLLKAAEKNRWAHVLCAKFIHETYFELPAFVDNILDVDKALEANKKRTCYLCGEKGLGACVTCSSKKCNKAFHVMCGRTAGLPLKEKNDMTVTFCHLHKDGQKSSSKRNENMDNPLKIVQEFILTQKKTGAGSLKILSSDLDDIRKEVDFPITDIAEYWQLKRKQFNGAPLNAHWPVKIVQAEGSEPDNVPNEHNEHEESVVGDDDTRVEKDAPEEEVALLLEAVAIPKDDWGHQAVALEGEMLVEEDVDIEDEAKEGVELDSIAISDGEAVPQKIVRLVDYDSSDDEEDMAESEGEEPQEIKEAEGEHAQVLNIEAGESVDDLQKMAGGMRLFLDNQRTTAAMVQKRELLKYQSISVSAKLFEKIQAMPPAYQEEFAQQMFDTDSIFNQPRDIPEHEDHMDPAIPVKKGGQIEIKKVKEERKRPEAEVQKPEDEKKQEFSDSEVTRCICGFIDEYGDMVDCEMCHVWQHRFCLNMEDDADVSGYLCELCDPAKVLPWSPIEARRKMKENLDYMKRRAIEKRLEKEAAEKLNSIKGYKKKAPKRKTGCDPWNGKSLGSPVAISDGAKFGPPAKMARLELTIDLYEEMRKGILRLKKEGMHFTLPPSYWTERHDVVMKKEENTKRSPPSSLVPFVYPSIASGSERTVSSSVPSTPHFTTASHRIPEGPLSRGLGTSNNPLYPPAGDYLD